ncbi:MAG: prepilin-type N-terminal cleavage/methylation domain-containing protein [Syntrophaceae bacterium]
MTYKKRFNQSGFTLIEIIVTVVIVAILGAMILTFLSKSLVDSRDPIRRLRKSSDLNRIMANITADYNRYPKWRSGTTYTAGNYVVPTIRNGHYYKVKACGATCVSDSIEPDWPLSSSSEKNDGSITWIETAENGSLLSLNSLQSNINSKNYGTYDIVENAYIHFDNDEEKSGGSNILKVKIKNEVGETLTALFISN